MYIMGTNIFVLLVSFVQFLSCFLFVSLKHKVCSIIVTVPVYLALVSGFLKLQPIMRKENMVYRKMPIGISVYVSVCVCVFVVCIPSTHIKIEIRERLNKNH